MTAAPGRSAPHPLGGKSAALAALCLGALILNVDTTIVTVALPDLVRRGVAAVGFVLVVVALPGRSRPDKSLACG
jgi:hypothetical protein